MRVIKMEKSQRVFELPNFDNLSKVFKSESILVFGKDTKDIQKHICLGVGRVGFIEKGEKFDIVHMNFGKRLSRKIIVMYNHARRQIYTLKRGQLAWFFGFFKFYTINKRQVAIFYAQGFQGWYVPKAVDIRNYNGEVLPELQDENDLSKFLDDIIGDDENGKE